MNPRKKPNEKPPGARNRLGLLKALKLIDGDTGELLATVRWRRCGNLYVQHAKHVKPRVVVDLEL